MQTSCTVVEDDETPIAISNGLRFLSHFDILEMQAEQRLASWLRNAESAPEVARAKWEQLLANDQLAWPARRAA